MTFAMVTTFFGSHSFGGDAAYVDRLARALSREGHKVHVIYCTDAFSISSRGMTTREYQAPPGVVLHPLKSHVGPLSPLTTHQTGKPFFKRAKLQELLDRIQPDVVHFHNISLIGGPGLFDLRVAGAIKLMTAHEHWLVCPLSVLWRHGHELCEGDKPPCISCSLAAGRPPQWWRAHQGTNAALERLDALICPSHSTSQEHARRGITVAMTRLPYFLPEDYAGGVWKESPRVSRPYLAAAGRLEAYKGFQDLIPIMDAFPELDLRIAGSGPEEHRLRTMAERKPNIRFEGRLDAAGVAALFRGARAVIVPSLVYETFGYVVLEAFSEATPVIARHIGALPELIEESGGGLTYRTSQELMAAIQRITEDELLRDTLGKLGYWSWREVWSEAKHLERYYALIKERRVARGLDRALPLTSSAAPVASQVAVEDQCVVAHPARALSSSATAAAKRA